MKIKEFDPISSYYHCVDTIDEAEALVTCYPNSSKAWVLYILFCLEQAEVSQARSVAQRALRTINFREDKEKLNVWKAYLNFENKYGSKESLENVLKEALIYQDRYEIYRHLVQLFIKCEKTEELVSLFRKYKDRKEIKQVRLSMYQNSKACLFFKNAANMRQPSSPSGQMRGRSSNAPHPADLNSFFSEELSRHSAPRKRSPSLDVSMDSPKRPRYYD